MLAADFQITILFLAYLATMAAVIFFTARFVIIWVTRLVRNEWKHESVAHKDANKPV